MSLLIQAQNPHVRRRFHDCTNCGEIAATLEWGGAGEVSVVWVTADLRITETVRTSGLVGRAAADVHEAASMVLVDGGGNTHCGDQGDNACDHRYRVEANGGAYQALCGCH